MKKIDITHKHPGQNQKPHHFVLDRTKTVKKGKLSKTRSGLYMVATEDKYVYHCPKCDSTIEINGNANIPNLNREVAETYTCV